MRTNHGMCTKKVVCKDCVSTRVHLRRVWACTTKACAKFQPGTNAQNVSLTQKTKRAQITKHAQITECAQLTECAQRRLGAKTARAHVCMCAECVRTQPRRVHKPDRLEARIRLKPAFHTPCARAELFGAQCTGWACAHRVHVRYLSLVDGRAFALSLPACACANALVFGFS